MSVIEVAKSPSGNAPIDLGVPDDATNAMPSTYNQEGTGVSIQMQEGYDANATRQQMDMEAMDEGMDNATDAIPELPEEQFAGKVSAWASKSLLKVLRSEATPKKKFRTGDTAPIEPTEPFEEISLDSASSLTGQSTSNFKTDDIWQTNFDMLENEDDVNGLIAKVSEDMSEQIMEARGGIRRDEEIIKLADDLGTDPEFVMEFMGAPDSQFVSPENILAARQVLNNSASYLHDLAVKVTAGKANPEEQLAFKKQYAFHQQFMGQFMAKRANVGRALRAYGLPTGSGDAQADHIQEMLHKVHGGLDIKQAAEQIASAPNNKAVHGMVDAQDSLMRQMGNVFIENFVNSILSGVKTHIINTTGSALMIGMKSLDTALAARLGTKIDDVAMRVDKDEWKAGVFGLMNGAQDALGVMWQVMKTGEAYGGVSKLENNGRAYISGEYLNIKGAAGTFVDGIGHVIRAPTERLMGGIDGFMKVIAERQSLAALAYRQANAEGQANKWSQEETLSRLQELMGTPTEDMINEAQESALHVTFQNPLGDWGQNIQKAAGSNPFTQYFMPFVKTPANLMKQGFLERTPLGLLTDKYRNDMAAGGARAQMANARMITGTSMVMIGGAAAYNGVITGGGSNNYKVKQAQMDSGWRPYSIVVTDDDGKKTYISYQRTEPLSYIFATIADFTDTTRLQYGAGVSEEKAGEMLVAALITAVSNATLDRSFMTGMQDAMDLLSDPTASRVQSYIKRAANANLPYSGLRRDITRSFDDSKKLTDGILTEMQANIPYYSQSLPNRLDSLGLPVKYDNVLNPLPIVGEKNNLILDEAARLGLALNKNPIALPQKAINGVKLTAQEYHDLVKYSRDTSYKNGEISFKKEMSKIIKSDEYQFATDDQKYTILRDITSTFDNQAKAKLYGENKDLFMRTQDRQNKQYADSLAKRDGTDRKSKYIHLKEKTSQAYDRVDFK
ncbi:MAG: hypothetical protein DRG30_07040 [Epsilonproteobacteria bacterium]|nr:MAG: hypothetical protein DRG30_07040 [Campylobacterota bacterium]